MDTLIIVLSVLVAVTTGIISAVVICGLIKDSKAQVATVPDTEESIDDTVAISTASATEAASDPAAVGAKTALEFGPTLTHEEKYKALSDVARGWYEDIVAYAAAVEGAQRILNKRYEEYSIGRRKIVRLTIKKGVPVCEFILPNSNLLTYASEKRIAVSTAPTTMKIIDEACVTAAKDTIDLAVKCIGEEKALKRRLANERRKQKNAQNSQNKGDIAE